MLTAATEAKLRGTALAMSWIGTTTSRSLLELAERLAFAVAAFEAGLVSTVVLPAFLDDPHGAFTNVPGVTATADTLARILDGFYAELAKLEEPTCGSAGKRIPLASNVVMVVDDDCMKNPFVRDAWPDGTPGSANAIYLRANGVLKTGWFGGLTPVDRIDFDPGTGAEKAPTAASQAAAKDAAVAAILHAITRGNEAYVATITNGVTYRGLVEPRPVP